MNHLKLLLALGAMAAGLGVVSLTACRTHSERITEPDGTIREMKDVEFLPNFNPMLLTYDVLEDGWTYRGLKIKRWVPRQGGRIVYEVEGNFFGFAVKIRNSHITLHDEQVEVDSEVSDFLGSEYRISADYFADSAVLEGQLAGTDSWQVVSSGDLETVAAAAMRLGLGAMEFENEFGTWSIQVDSPFPVVVTSLNGEIIDVRGVRQPIKPLMDTSMHERCR